MPAPSRRRGVALWIVGVVGALGLFSVTIVTRVFFVEAFQVPAASMAPTLLIGDHIFVDKRATTPRRGDVIVFKYPHDPSIDYVKRVVGVAGDAISMRGEELVVNGQVAARERLDEACEDGRPDAVRDDTCVVWEETLDGRAYRIMVTDGRGDRDFEPRVVPPGQLFVLGDNRDNSSDSRVWGFVPLEDVKGTVVRIWWNRAHHERMWRTVR